MADELRWRRLFIGFYVRGNKMKSGRVGSGDIDKNPSVDGGN